MNVDTKKVAVVKGQVTKAERVIKGFQIKTQADYDLAGAKFIELKKIEKDFKAEERSWLDPINQLRNKVFSYTRPARARLTEILAQLNSAMAEYEQQVEAERLKETDKLEEQVKSGDMTLADATDKAGKLGTVDSVESAKGKMHTRTQFDLIVKDQAIVPEQFKTVDMVAVRDYYNSTGKLPAGIEITKRQVRVARTV